MTDEEQFLQTPIGFVTQVLGLPLYEWQGKAITPLYKAEWGKPIVQISVLAPNEAGKSSQIVAGSALYWAAIKNGKVSITTKDGRQLNEQIIPALEAQIHKLGFKSVRAPFYKITGPKIEGTEKVATIIAYTTDDPARVEGFHGAPDQPLLTVVDEAKSVSEPNFQALDRCGYQALLYCSSGGLMQGTFWKSQTENKAMFKCVTAGLKDCPHIGGDKVERIITKWGENHPFTRSCIYGEFMEQDDETQFCVTHSSLRKCLDNPPRHRPGLRVAFVDFADGNAEYVLAIRDGNKTDIACAFREADKRTACARLIASFVQNGLKQEEITGDAADKEACDHLAQLGWHINRKNFGSKAKLEEVYQSWSAEAWIETGIGISKGELIVPQDEILFAQLTSRKKEFVGRGKMAVEEKHEMRKRGIESPDRADAYCGCQNIYPIAQAGRFWQRESWGETAQPKNEFEESLRAIGAFAG